MKNKIIIVTVVALVVVGAWFMFFSNSSDNSSTTENTENQQLPVNNQTDINSNNNPIEEPTDAKVFSSSEVAIHNTQADCWTIIDGSVYDISQYVSRHPGGNVILQACGSDGTTLFNMRETQEGEKIGSGTPHSSTANSILAEYYIGELAD